MPDTLIAAVAVTAAAGILPALFMLLYRIMLSFFWKKAEGRITGRDIGYKNKIYSSSYKLSEKDEEELPLKAIIEFQAGDRTVRVLSRYQYDKESLDRLFEGQTADVLYSSSSPETGYIITKEYKKRAVGIGVKLMLLSLCLISVEVVALLYLEMFR